jgi:hypothetical protein
MRLVLILTFIAFASIRAAAEPAERSLLTIRENRRLAQRGGDAQTWARYTTADFFSISSDGALKTKAQRMREIEGIKITTPPHDDLDVQFQVFATVATRTWREDDEGGGLRFSELWVKDGADWKCAGVQQTRIAKKR